MAIKKTFSNWNQFGDACNHTFKKGWGPGRGCEVTRGHDFWRWGQGHPLLNLRGHQNRSRFARSTPVLNELIPKILHSIAFQISWIERVLTQNPWFWCISDLLNWKFSSTMVKYWMSFNPKSLMLVHFRFLELKIFFNHGELLNEFILHSSAFLPYPTGYIPPPCVPKDRG